MWIGLKTTFSRWSSHLFTFSTIYRQQCMNYSHSRSSFRRVIGHPLFQWHCVWRNKLTASWGTVTTASKAPIKTFLWEEYPQGRLKAVWPQRQSLLCNSFVIIVVFVTSYHPASSTSITLPMESHREALPIYLHLGTVGMPDANQTIWNLQFLNIMNTFRSLPASADTIFFLLLLLVFWMRLIQHMGVTSDHPRSSHGAQQLMLCTFPSKPPSWLDSCVKNTFICVALLQGSAYKTNKMHDSRERPCRCVIWTV